jgi:hypothetical protein
MTFSTFTGVGSEKKRAPTEDATRNDIDGDVPAVLFALKPDTLRRKTVLFLEDYVERSRVQVHAGLVEVVILKPLDPKAETPDPARDGSAQHRHWLYCTRNLFFGG